MDIRQLILPAGVGLSHLRVYTEPGPDGVCGGSPHFHTVCSEMYYVLSGEGALELLCANGYEHIALAPGRVVFFWPGMIHRLHNPGKNLEILIIMQNGGLAERGDFILTFSEKIMTDDNAYAAAIRVSSHADAIERRNLAVEGFLPLRQAMLDAPEQGREMLRRFYRHARRILTPKAASFEWVLKSGALWDLKESQDAVDFIRDGRLEYLEKSRWSQIYPMNDSPKPGLCGDLRPYAVDEEFLAEGLRVA